GRGERDVAACDRSARNGKVRPVPGRVALHEIAVHAERLRVSAAELVKARHHEHRGHQIRKKPKRALGERLRDAELPDVVREEREAREARPIERLPLGEPERALALAQAREALELHGLPKIEASVVLALAVLAAELFGERDDVAVFARREETLETKRAGAVARLAVLSPSCVEPRDLFVGV